MSETLVRYHHLLLIQQFYLHKPTRQSLYHDWALAIPLQRPDYHVDIFGHHPSQESVLSFIDQLTSFAHGVLSLPPDNLITLLAVQDSICNLCVEGKHCQAPATLQLDQKIHHNLVAATNNLDLKLPIITPGDPPASQISLFALKKVFDFYPLADA